MESSADQVWFYFYVKYMLGVTTGGKELQFCRARVQTVFRYMHIKRRKKEYFMLNALLTAHEL